MKKILLSESSRGVNCRFGLMPLRVFWTEGHYTCPFRYRLELCISKFTTLKYRDVCFSMFVFRGQFKLGSLLNGSSPRACGSSRLQQAENNLTSFIAVSFKWP